jgi:FkbM family methyltransferase
MILEPVRQLGKRVLRRWPNLYARGKRCYGHLIYRLGIPHDSDFAFFRNFKGRAGLVVDVGANTGQSARSIRIYNRSLEILSFEPNRLLEPELHATRKLLGPLFDYHMVGLGRRDATLTLYCPVAGETPLTPWATGDRASIERNRAVIEREVGTKISVTAVPVEIRRFDDLDLSPLAIKIDVEGLELEVLSGMTETLARCEPILMIECSTSTSEVVQMLSVYGYHTYAYDPHGNRLKETRDPGSTTNYFALTPRVLEDLLKRSQLRLDRRVAEPMAV